MNVNSRTSKINFTGFASGAIASFTGLREAPIKVAAQIVPIQSGSGDPAPDNIRPIAGWSEVTISVADDSMEVQDTYTIPFGQTIYGGELDVTTGVLTVDKGYILLTGANDEGWGNYSAYNGFYLTGLWMKSGTTLDGICSHFRSNVGWTSLGVRFGANNSYIYFLQITRDIQDVTDIATWKTWLSNNPVQLVYSLAEPITIQLTPTQVKQLLGQNNVWADTGNVKVFYVTI